MNFFLIIMGGIYSTTEKSSPNCRQNNGNSLINFSADNTQINNGAYTSAFHPSAIGSVNRPSHNELNNTINGAFGRSLNPNISSNHGSFSLQNQRTREKSNDELLNYRYISDGNLFQARNLSQSPNSMLSNPFKPNYTHNQLLLNNTMQQSRQGNVLTQINVTKSDALQNNQMHQSCSKLNSDVSNRVNSNSYSINAQHMNQSGLFQTSKRIQLLSQPPNKRPRLSHDFTNITHQNPNNISKGTNFLNLNHSDKKLSSSPQKHIQNMSIYKDNLASSNGVWPNKEPSYYPQVEAISPVPDEMRHCELKSVTEKDDIGEKLRNVEDEIIKQQEHVTRLREKTDLLNNKINQPNIDNYSKEENSLVPLSRDPIQLIITNNQRKATEQYQLFQRFCGEHVSWNPLTLPIYKQPSDIELLINVKNHFHKTFKPILTKYIRRRKLAERARLKILAEEYEVSAKAWYKRLEKFENSVKRRQKELKYREQFEKIFPEIKRNREDKEKDTSELTDGLNFSFDNNVGVTNSFANTRSVSHNCNGVNMSEQQRSHTPYDSVKENEKMKEYAIDPPIILPNWNKNFGLTECARLIKDPKHKHLNFQNYKTNWSREEIEIFKEQYIILPKNFGRISSFLPKKTVSDCIQYYYLTKKTANYKALVKKNARRRRVQAERQQRYRGEADNSANIGTNQQSTSELIMDQSINQTGERDSSNTKMDPLLSLNFIEIENIPKESMQKNSYNSENSCQQPPKYCCDKSNIQSDPEKKNSGQDQPTKSNKETNACCSDRNSILRDSRDSDSDENDDAHRSQLLGECFVSSSNSSQLNKNSISESEYKPEKERQSDKCSDNYFSTTSKPLPQTNPKFESKISSNSLFKPEYIHIKDAIEYSIEQSLSQCSESKKEVNKFQKIDSNNILNDQFYEKKLFKSFDNHSLFQNISLDEAHHKNISIMDNVNENYKHNYSSQPIRDNSNFQDIKKDVIKSVDNSVQLNSTFNRKILMKDFCTAQMINHGPINSSLNSKSHSVIPKTPTNSNFMDLMTKKSDFFIDRVSKLYEEEVEPYTDEFRNRSDSQRTRTSSEASQMYAYIKDRSLKSENRATISSSKTYEDKIIPLTDSRLKMPPPEVTDQKVFRSQKYSFSSKKSPYLKTVISKDCDMNENDSGKAKLIIDDSVDDIEEITEKRKIVTAANILNSIIDKNANCNNEVTLITSTNKICDNPSLKSNDKLIENSSQKNHFVKNYHMTLDGHIKQNLSEKKPSNSILENKKECSKRNCTVPLKKREKSILSDDRNKSEKFNKTSVVMNIINKKSRNVSDSPESLSKCYFEKNNNVVYKEKLEVETDDNYDSESPRFNSPGKLLIDLGNNSEGY